MLTDAQGFELVLADGFVAGEGCDAACCGGEPECPLWIKLLQCNNGPACGAEPVPLREVWVCANSVCLDGTGLFPGWVILIDGLCYVVTNQGVTQRPPGADYIPEGQPLDCVGFSACGNARCPQGAVWFLGQPCDPASPPVYFCAITQCGVYRAVVPGGGGGCYLVDPAAGPVSLPPGARTSGPSTRFVDCCSCNSSSGTCRQCAVHDTQPGVLCCYSLLAELRYTQYRSEQTLIISGQVRQRIVTVGGYLVGLVFSVVQTYDLFAVAGFPDSEHLVEELFRGPVGGAGACGWGGGLINPSDLALLSTRWTLWACTSGVAEDVFGNGGCLSGACDGGSLVFQCSESFSCGAYTRRIASDYINPGFNRHWISEFVVSARITDPAGSVCMGGCNGQLVSPDPRFAPRLEAGFRGRIRI